MKEFRKYECEGDVDYVLFCGDNLSCVWVYEVSLQEGLWYISESVWGVDFLPETAEEFAQVAWDNDLSGCSCGSWESVSEIDKKTKCAEHDEIIKHFGL